ncbi:UNVERIFIED_CONTAM: hypothetical protein Slati_3870300 [Sesamum latifolium]|uniref:Uncharacterized protein n=1 Tax=Sesamum latifolium TaxID=2727402 RepID=A0AAW2TLR2_9LAMI
MCYVGKATKIFIFIVTALVVTGLVLGFGLLRHHGKSHKCSPDSCPEATPVIYPTPNPDPASSFTPNPSTNPNPAPSPPPPPPADNSGPSVPDSPPPPTLSSHRRRARIQAQVVLICLRLRHCILRPRRSRQLHTHRLLWWLRRLHRRRLVLLALFR